MLRGIYPIHPVCRSCQESTPDPYRLAPDGRFGKSVYSEQLNTRANSLLYSGSNYGGTGSLYGIGSTGIQTSSIDPYENSASHGDRVGQLASAVFNSVPVIGTLKGFAELGSGRDIFTGERVSEGAAGFNIVSSAIPMATAFAGSAARSGAGSLAQIAAAKGGVPNPNVGNYLAGKAPTSVTPGTKMLEGQYVDDLGRVQPWRAHYDQYGRQIARTDMNAGNNAAGIPDTHHHTYEYNGRFPKGRESGSHLPGEYIP